MKDPCMICGPLLHCVCTWQDKVQTIQNKFRLIAGWRIEYDNQSKYKAQVDSNFKTKTATIYGWGEEEKTPEDFLLHEVLHICMKEIIQSPAKTRCAKEEILVQDICSIMIGRPVNG